jgi:hypothetical protein
MSDERSSVAIRLWATVFNFDTSRIGEIVRSSGKMSPLLSGYFFVGGVVTILIGLIVPGIIPVYDARIGLNGECGSAYFPANTGDASWNIVVNSLCQRTGILDAYMGWRTFLVILGVLFFVISAILGYNSSGLIKEYDRKHPINESTQSPRSQYSNNRGASIPGSDNQTSTTVNLPSTAGGNYTPTLTFATGGVSYNFKATTEGVIELIHKLVERYGLTVLPEVNQLVFVQHHKWFEKGYQIDIAAITQELQQLEKTAEQNQGVLDWFKSVEGQYDHTTEGITQLIETGGQKFGKESFPQIVAYIHEQYGEWFSKKYDIDFSVIDKELKARSGV